MPQGGRQGRDRTARWFAVLLACSAASCAMPSQGHKLGMQQMLAASNYDGAVSWIDRVREDQYGRRNAVLYHLDRAMILHEAARYRSSDQAFDQAELQMEALFTTSLSKAAGKFFLNDATEDYAGEPYERSLLHVYRALNYVYMEQLEEALVEARKVSSYLQELRDKYQFEITYRDDAFAHYLCSLLFEDAGRTDDARISRELAMQAYEWSAKAFGTPAPQFDLQLTSADEGELVLLHSNGVAPRKISRTYQIAWNDAIAAVHASEDTEGQARNALVAGVMADAITVAFPELVQDRYLVGGSRVWVGQRSAATQLVENFSAIAAVTLQDRIASIRVRAIARATIKFLVAKVAEKATERAAGRDWGLLMGIAARMVAAGTESADTRGWATAPAEIRMARMLVPPGRHRVQIQYLGRDGNTVFSQVLEDVEVLPGQRVYVHVRTAL